MNEEEEIFAEPSDENYGMGFLTTWIELVQANGWFILIACVVLYYLYNKYKNNLPSLSAPRSMHREGDESEQLAHMQRIESVRLRQQAAMDAAAAKYLEEKKVKDEILAKKKEEEWELHQQGLGYRSKTKKAVEDEDLAALGLKKKNLSAKPRLRDSDYNPLTGQSNSGTGRMSFKRAQPSRGG